MTTRVVVSITCINGDNPARRMAIAHAVKRRLEIISGMPNLYLSEAAVADTAISINIEETDEEQTAL